MEEAFIASHTAHIFIERTLVATSNEYEYLVPEEVRQQSNNLKKALLFFDNAIEQLETSLLFYRSEGLPSLTAPVRAQVHHARP